MSEQVSANTEVHGAVEECLPTNRRVPGSTPGEIPDANVQSGAQFEVENTSNEELPQLRLYDQTPTVDRKTAKRPCTELSPINESPTKLITDDMWKQIERTITSTINSAIPNIIENIVCELQCTFNGMIDRAITTAKTEIYDEVRENIATAKTEIFEVRENINFVDSKIAVRTKCEAEQLETYNRRDNIKILGLREDANGNGEIKGENIEQTLDKVIDLSKKLEADVDSRDTHQLRIDYLPGRGIPSQSLSNFPGEWRKLIFCARKSFCMIKAVRYESLKTLVDQEYCF